MPDQALLLGQGGLLRVADGCSPKSDPVTLRSAADWFPEHVPRLRKRACQSWTSYLTMSRTAARAAAVLLGGLRRVSSGVPIRLSAVITPNGNVVALSSGSCESREQWSES